MRHTPRPRLDDPAVRVTGLLVTWAGMTFALLVYLISQGHRSQGRLLFPGIIAFGILLAMGLDSGCNTCPGSGVAPGGPHFLPCCLACRPMRCRSCCRELSGAGAGHRHTGNGHPAGLEFGDEGALLAGRGKPRRNAIARRVPVTLYLQTNQVLDHDYQLFIQFLDEQGAEVANLTSHPGWGRNPTRFWQPGALYADRYDVLVTGAIDALAVALAPTPIYRPGHRRGGKPAAAGALTADFRNRGDAAPCRRRRTGGTRDSGGGNTGSVSCRQHLRRDHPPEPASGFRPKSALPPSIRSPQPCCGR